MLTGNGCPQEDAIITDDDSDIYCPFELPEDEYGDLMFARRLALEGSSSPATSGHPESRRGSTVADTDGQLGVLSFKVSER